MTSVDSRIVEMSLDATKLVSGVSPALSALDKLKQGLGLSGASKGLTDLENTASKFSLAGMANATEGISKSFIALSTVGITALSDITSKAVDAGLSIAKSFTLDPISDGFSNYETQINATRTILSNTMAAGTNLSDVTPVLQDLNKYAQLTVYNFADMAKNIGTFTAAGVGLQPATEAIKGIANLAALSGSTAEQASGAMYQLSQAIASGRVSLQDYNSVVNAGIGGSVLQRALTETAVATGALDKNAVKFTGDMKNVSINGESFRNSISSVGGAPSWLTSDVLTKTLSEFTGDLSDAQLAADGFSKSEIKAIQAQASAAVNAATQVKTFSQLTQSLKEEVAGAYASIFTAIFGNINQATKLFSALHTSIENALTGPILSLGTLLQNVTNLGGRSKALKGLANIFQFLGSVLAPVKEAFHDVFPPATAIGILNLIESFQKFTKTLKLSKDTATGIRDTFRGLFAVFDIALQIVKGLAHYFLDFFGVLLGGSGSIFQLTGSFGDLLYRFDEFLKKGQYISNFFDTIIKARDAVLVPLVKVIGNLISAFADLAQGDVSGFFDHLVGLSSQLGKAVTGLGGTIGRVFSGIGTVLGLFGGRFSGLQKILDSVAGKVATVFGNIGSFLKKGDLSSLFNFDPSNILGTVVGYISVLKKDIQNLLATDPSVLFKRILGYVDQVKSAFSGLSVDGPKKLIDSASSTASSVAGSVGSSLSKSFSTNFPKIMASLGNAISSGIQAVAKNVAPIAKTIGAVLVSGFNYLVTNMPAIASAVGKALAYGLTAVVVAVPAIASAIGLGLFLGIVNGIKALPEAFHKIVSQLKFSFSTGSADKGASGLTKSLGGLSGIAKQVQSAWQSVLGVFHSVGDAVTASGGYIAKAFGKIKDFIGANFGNIGIQDILGLVNGIFAGTLIHTISKFVDVLKEVVEPIATLKNSFKGVFTQVTDNLKTMQKAVRAEIIKTIAESLLLMAAALFVLSKINAVALGKSLGALTVLITELVIAMKILDKQIEAEGSGKFIALAVGIAALGVALLAIAGAVYIMGKLNSKELAKGLIGVSVSIGVIVAAAAVLGKTGGGLNLIGAAAAMLILSVALIAFVGALKLYASLDTKTIASGGLKVAATLIAVGIGLRAFPGPSSVLSAVSLGIVAVSLLLLAQTLQEFAKFSADEIKHSLIELGGALLIIAIAVAAMSDTAAGSLALIAVAFALSMLVKSLALLGGLSVGTIVKSLVALAAIFAVLVIAGIALSPVVLTLVALGAAIALIGGGILAAGAGLVLFAAGLTALSITGAAGFAILTAGVISFLSTLPLIAQQVGLSLVAFAKVIGTNAPTLIAALGNLIKAMINQGIKLVPRMGALAQTLILTFLRILRNTAPAMIKTGVALVQDLLNGLDSHINDITASAVTLIAKFITSIGKQANKLTSAGVVLIVNYINGLAIAIRANASSLGSAGGNLAAALIEGMAIGLYHGVSRLVQIAVGMAGSIIGAFKKKLGIASPSKVFKQFGGFVTQGFANGLIGGLTDVNDAMDKFTTGIKDKLGQLKDTVNKDKDNLKNLEDAKNKDHDAIAKAKAALAKSQKEENEASKTTKNLIASIKDHKAKVQDLGNQYDAYSKQIGTATDLTTTAYQKLEAATQLRDDFQKSTTTTFDVTPDINTGTSVATYTKGLQKQIDATNNFKSSLDQLRAEGLDDDTYQKLLAQGVDAQPFVTKLLAAGPDSVAAIATLNSQLDTAANNLGTDASVSMYQAGVDVAAGLVKGLQDEQQAVVDQMSAIADLMLTTVKKKHKSHSPSLEFAKIGVNAADGLILGLRSSLTSVAKASDDFGSTALNTIKASLSDLDSQVSNNINASPVITPVLDLTQLSKDATQIGTMINTDPIQPYASLVQANAISKANQDLQNGSDSASAAPQTTITLTQNNTSPKSLSEVDIYRSTKNLISLTKEALKV